MTAYQWEPSRNSALQQLSEFLPKAGRQYADNRNYDNGPAGHGGVSRLSPWLRCRLISEQEVVTEVLRHHTERAAEKYLQEVFWRSYWKGWLEMRPQVWHQYQSEQKRLYADDKIISEVVSVIENGCGIDCFDHWCQELKSTGYLHNHARMWFASIWIFTLRLPWQLGADFFIQHLLDGDPASNTLSWRWVAGMQTKGKAYAASAENIAKYTNDRFNPVGKLHTDIAPLVEDIPVERQDLPVVQGSAPTGRVGLILHEDDLHIEPLGTLCEFDSVICLQTRDLVSPGGVADNVSNFVSRAIESALKGRSVAVHAKIVCSDHANIQRCKDSILQWAVDNQLDAVAWAYAPTGPTASVLKEFSDLLLSHGIDCHVSRRQWDSTVWPHAGKGFFALKKQIPELIKTLKLSPA